MTAEKLQSLVPGDRVAHTDGTQGVVTRLAHAGLIVLWDDGLLRGYRYSDQDPGIYDLISISGGAPCA